jgi:sugar phosphate isomerase/epimerase
VEWVEVRTLVSGRFPRVPDPEIEAFAARLGAAGMGVSGVSPGFFKGAVDDPTVLEAIAADLPRACAWARRLGTDRVSCFAFARQGGEQVPQQVVDRLGEMARVTAAHGCRLSLENEAGCWGGTGPEAAAIIRRVGASSLGLCWDPGNAARAGSPCPYPDEYRQVADLVAHVHAKNYDPDQRRWSLIEQGVVDWPGQLRALAADRYDGFLVVETHLDISPDEFLVLEPDLDGLAANTLRNLRFVRSCLAGGSA